MKAGFSMDGMHSFSIKGKKLCEVCIFVLCATCALCAALFLSGCAEGPKFEGSDSEEAQVLPKEISDSLIAPSTNEKSAAEEKGESADASEKQEESGNADHSADSKDADSSSSDSKDSDVGSSEADDSSTSGDQSNSSDKTADNASAEELWEQMDISTDFREGFYHGSKDAQYQKYIVLHDTEGTGTADSVIDWWDSNGNLVAAHFIVNKDGSIVQCVPLDVIAHHAGFGDVGHNEYFGVEDESRDDKKGTTSIGSSYPDYGMNSYSIGIEMVHSGSGDYPEAQLEALDTLIAYIDAYYGFESKIIDHKAWRSTNSDTSQAFAGYLASYQSCRKHTQD